MTHIQMYCYFKSNIICEYKVFNTIILYGYIIKNQEQDPPKPKSSWNSNLEQIWTLEAIFNHGMVNPPRDEKKKEKNLKN